MRGPIFIKFWRIVHPFQHCTLSTNSNRSERYCGRQKFAPPNDNNSIRDHQYRCSVRINMQQSFHVGFGVLLAGAEMTSKITVSDWPDKASP